MRYTRSLPMPPHSWGRCFAAALAVALVAAAALAADSGKPGAVRIGLPANLFRDVPKPAVQALLATFAGLMEKQTGVTGELVLLGDTAELGRELDAGRIQLAVFHGFEFAWERSRHPELRPLCIAVNQQQKLSAHLVVCQNCQAKSAADLRGKVVALPRGSREHCRLFLNRRLARGERAEVYYQVVTPPNVSLALEDVLNGKAEAAVVDGVSLETFKFLSPAQAAQLKVLQSAEGFPAGVVAYRSGGLDETSLRKFRDGLLRCKATVEGQQLMMLWKLSAFEAVPADYEPTLTEILRQFPPPPAEK